MRFLENKWMRAAVPALLIHCSIGTVYCWSSFSGELAQQLGVSSGLLGWAFSLAIFFLGMSAAFGGRFVEKDIHASSLLACIFFTAGMAGTGLTIRCAPLLGPGLTVAGIFFFYGCVMGIGLGIGYLTPVKTLMLWFSDSKGLATGISIMGFGLAKAIASPIMNLLVVKTSVSTMFLLLAGVYFLMMLLGHFLLKKPAGWREDADARLSLRRLLKSPTFIGCWLMFYLNITCGLALIACEKPILKVIGLSTAAISAVQSCTAGANALGRLGFSSLSDKLSDRNRVYQIIFVLSAGVCAAAFFTRAISGSLAAMAVLLLLAVNAGYGGGFSTMPALLSSRFGMQHISRIHGYVLSAWAFAGLTGNQMSTLIYQVSGRYEPVLGVLAVLYLLALAVCTTLVHPGRAALPEE